MRNDWQSLNSWKLTLEKIPTCNNWKYLERNVPKEKRKHVQVCNGSRLVLTNSVVPRFISFSENLDFLVDELQTWILKEKAGDHIIFLIWRFLLVNSCSLKKFWNIHMVLSVHIHFLVFWIFIYKIV